MRRPFSASALLVLIALAVIAGATLTPMAASPRAGGPVWCVACGSRWLTDALTNVALFVPLGAAFALHRIRWRWIVVGGALLSLGIETLQFAGIPWGRTASLADWLTNSAGCALGAALIRSSATLRAPSPAVARRLSLAWSALLVFAMIGTSWALLPMPASPIAFAATIQPSALTHAPRYGWYTPESDRAVVNAQSIAHQGSGPVLIGLRAPATTIPESDSVVATIHVRGRDARRFFVPMMYVHDAAHDDQPVLVLGQRGDAVVVRSLRRGQRIGLAVPDAIARGVFDDAFDAAGERTLRATVTRGALSVSATASSGRAVTATVALTPALGWTMLQTVVQIDSPVATSLSMVWIALWFALGAMWAARAWRRVGAMVWSACMLAFVWGGVRGLAMPMLSSAHIALALSAAFLAAQTVSRPTGTR